MCWSVLKEDASAPSPSVHSPDNLKEAPVPIISTKRCNSSCMYNGEITSRMLCAGYTEGKVDACQVSSIFSAARHRDVFKKCFLSSLICSEWKRQQRKSRCLMCASDIVCPGWQWGSFGMSGWKRVEAGGCRQLGFGLCWAQPSWSLHQSRWILGLDLWHDWGKLSYMTINNNLDLRGKKWLKSFILFAELLRKTFEGSFTADIWKYINIYIFIDEVYTVYSVLY